MLFFRNIFNIIFNIIFNFFLTELFLFPEIINRENILSQKRKKQNHIDPKFLLTFQSLFLVDRFGFYFEAISPWDHAIAL